MSRVELPDGRVLAFRGDQVVAFNLAEAQRHARRGRRTRRQAVAEVYPRDDGTWEVSDPNKELNLVSDLAAAVLFSCAALEGLGDRTVRHTEQGAIVEMKRDGEAVALTQALSERLVRLWRLRDGLVRPQPVPEGPDIFGMLVRGDADSCADDAMAAVRALRPEFLPSGVV